MSELAAEGHEFHETVLRPPSYWMGGAIVCLVWWIGAIIAGAAARAQFTAQFTTVYTPDSALMVFGFIHSLGVLIRILVLPVVLAGAYGLLRRSASRRDVGRIFFWVSFILLIAHVIGEMPISEWMAPPPA